MSAFGGIADKAAVPLSIFLVPALPLLALTITNTLIIAGPKNPADAAVFYAVSQNLMKCEAGVKIFVH
jgi:hypothetical protein